eukprot:gnl/Chilomastix_caulleri/6065.p1 GENE.gnl/Chilomastix_caulleri/6065~~gnl/Chilomastix_caulleri/6065.p1  ORF type:complete len:91 (-),score=29.71 gnl/Chilomastix_caulleri/6065:60-332(-)
MTDSELDKMENDLMRSGLYRSNKQLAEKTEEEGVEGAKDGEGGKSPKIHRKQHPTNNKDNNHLHHNLLSQQIHLLREYPNKDNLLMTYNH